MHNNDIEETKTMQLSDQVRSAVLKWVHENYPPPATTLSLDELKRAALRRSVAISNAYLHLAAKEAAAAIGQRVLVRAIEGSYSSLEELETAVEKLQEDASLHIAAFGLAASKYCSAEAESLMKHVLEGLTEDLNIKGDDEDARNSH